MAVPGAEHALTRLLCCHAVWDSSIVVAKYAERWPDRFRGKRCLDLSAGCGLIGERQQAPCCMFNVS
jgi:predicted nicotinamide N-methyase